MKSPPMVFHPSPDGGEVAFIPLSEFKSVAAKRDELREDVQNLARELLLAKLTNLYCLTVGAFPSSRDAMSAIESEPAWSQYKTDIDRIRDLARLAGGWWVSPTEFAEGSQ